MSAIGRGSPWRAITRQALDTVFPPRCAGCKARGCWLCPACLGRIDYLAAPLCGACRQPITPGAPAHGCRIASGSLASISAIGVYAGPLRAAVQALKYEGRHGIAASLAPLLAARIASLIEPDDLVVPIPLHPSRERERGYNQSAILTAEVVRLLPFQAAPRALRRRRATADQTRLTEAQRAANMRGAFEARPELVRDRQLWLLDDVYTTGATLRAGAAALRAAGARDIRGVVVAMTPR